MIETGFLQLEVEPRQSLQIFVDGLYVGTLADLGDEIELRLGARRIELRAPGYRTLIFDTQIVPDRTIVYRGALEPIANAPSTSTQAPQAPRAPQAPEAPQAPRHPQSRPIYVIPGCYMGNVSPTAVDAASRLRHQQAHDDFAAVSFDFAQATRRFNFRNAASISA